MHRYNSEWHDMSDYVVHFTKEYGGKSAYDNVMGILFYRVLHAVNPFGIMRNRASNSDSQRAACFSEIPLHLINRLAQRRGLYGVGFTKRFLLEHGGGPIWYVEHRSPSEQVIQRLITEALGSTSSQTHPIWHITPFIDSPGDYPGGSYRFEWEREWRIVGDLHFTENDVAFLIIPEELHGFAQGFFQDAYENNTGPAYFCPFIDALWGLDRVRQALEQ